MKKLFPGYFTPTEEEFKRLWGECVFAFDANVLLGLYRSTTETREIFFEVLEKIRDRIFLPYQAASEYLRNRLDTISVRAKQYENIKTAADKFAKAVGAIVEQHSILRGTEMSAIAEDCVGTIIPLADEAAAGEPDLLRQDEILTRLAQLFEARTGEPFEDARVKEIFAEGARRYSQAVPPVTRTTRSRSRRSTAIC